MIGLLIAMGLGVAQAGAQLTVLGIAQDAGHPQAGCTRSCCAAAWDDPTKGHKVTSLGLSLNGQHWLVDASPDLPRQLHALGDGTLAGVFLTHAHIGHYTGLMHLGREAMGTEGVPVHAMPRMHAFLEKFGPWELLLRLGNAVIAPLEDDKPVELGHGLVVTPFVVPHRDEYSETVGYRIAGSKQTVAYLPDIDKWAKWKHPVERLIAGVDVAFLDGTFYSDGELPGRNMSEIPHPFIMESLERLGSLPEAERAKVHFIHLNHTNPVLDPGSDASQAVQAAGFRVAREGMQFEL